MSVPFELFIHQNRTTDWAHLMLQTDGSSAVVAASGDAVRFKIGLGDLTVPILDLDSIAAAAGGSLVTIVDGSLGSISVRIAQADIAALKPNSYRAEVAIIDVDDSNLIKYARQGVCHVLGAPGGDITET